MLISKMFFIAKQFSKCKICLLEKKSKPKKLQSTQIFGTLHFLASKKELPLKGTVA
jgi:hypothetical protein